MNATAPTLFACLTPPGAAAIATLAVRGPGAWKAVRALFRPRFSASALPDEPQPGRFWLGRLGADLADEVIVAVKRGGPAPWVEIHCHGGREVLRLLQSALEGQGATRCDWQELERRTADDPLPARALAALAEAKTVRTAAILLDQYHGAFRRAVEAIQSALARGDEGEAARGVTELARFSRLGRHLKEPWRVAVVGAPNVGKSSLINALAGYQRSIVSATPGTTRDVVTTLVAFDGWPVELADTAGLRAEAGDLEGQGIGKARAAARAADLCLWVLDASAPPAWPEPSLAPPLLVVNKIDLPPAWDVDQAAGAVRVSARTGEGLANLCQAIAGRLVPEAPAAGAAVPFTAELCDRVEEALANPRRAAGLVPADRPGGDQPRRPPA